LRSVAHAIAGQRRQLDQHEEDAADDRAPGQPHNAQRGHEGEKANEVADVQRHRGQRGQNEMLVGVQDAAEHAADAENRRLDEDDAHDPGCQLLLGRREVGHEDVGRQPGGQKGPQSRDAPQQQNDQGQHRVSQPGALGPLRLIEILTVDRNEGRGQRTAGDDHKEHFGQLIGGSEGVERGRCAERLGHQPGAE